MLLYGFDGLARLNRRRGRQSMEALCYLRKAHITFSFNQHETNEGELPAKHVSASSVIFYSCETKETIT